MSQSQQPTHDDRIALTRAIMNIVDAWGIPGPALLEVLALPAGTPVRALRRYRENTPFPDELAVMERIEHIIGIADALRTSYPHNPAMGALWMRQDNQRFEQRAPLDLIIEDGLPGLIAVRMHLDCSYDWYLDKGVN